MASTSNGVSVLFFTSFLLLLLQVSFIHASCLHCAADSSSSSSSSCSNSNNNRLPLVNGLSWSFYESSCPNVKFLIRSHLKKVFTNDIGLAAGLLRLHFHDCFVQGCDGSVLLDGSASGPSEKEAPPNLSLRAQAFKIIEDLRALVHHHCGSVVSCADIVAVAARDSVFLSGGPEYEVPLGRRDGLTFATRNATLANLPAPTSNAGVILESLATKGFDPTDVVALSGGHTIGISHCTSFTNRLYPNQDPVMDQTFADKLKLTCPTANTTNTTVIDLRTPDLFDNKYYVDLVNRQGLFTSDQDLFTDERTKEIVTEFAENQSLFFDKFADAVVKMGQLGVLTGNNGEIRRNCSVRNQDYESFLRMYQVEDAVEDRSEL
ncbi:peroxidase 12-like [Neltuma alba]|uniref:peroxidase 12-like n=1 Tax=Neltuma alba TaxID=207710 RepID=UPI0010A2D222|nr:peroxidase 12-like [Prosopis alba]